MNKDLSEIWMILDRSGSMESIHSGTVEAVNAFLVDQRKGEGQVMFTLRQFDEDVLTTYDRVPIHDVPFMKMADFEPRGLTALYDAVGQAILDLGKTLSKTPEKDRPATVVITILTDGIENVSTEFTLERVSTLIEQQQAVYKWEFIFLGADFDVDVVADSMNVSKERRIKFRKCKKGIRDAVMESSLQINTMRTEARKR